MIISNSIAIGVNYVIGEGESYITEYQNVLNRWSALGIALPDDAKKTKDNTLVTTLVDIGAWALEDVFWNTVVHNENAALVNWKTLSTFPLTKVGTLTFTANQGFTGNGTNGYLTTGWIPNTHGVNYTLNNASAIAYTATDLARNTDNLFGASDAAAANRLVLAPRNASSAMIYNINKTTSTSLAGNNNSTGFYHLKRTASNAFAVFKNGVSISSGTTASTARPGVQLYLLADNANGTAGGFSQRQIGMFAAGASLNGLESGVYNAWNTYLTSL